LGSKSHWENLYPERKEKQDHLWEKIGEFFRRYEQEWSPASLKIFVYREGWYLLVRFALLCVLFVLISGELNPWNIIILIATIYLLLDLLIANTSVSFVTMDPINSLRSFLLTLFAFTHVIIAYGIFYKFYGDQFNSNMCDSQVLYFSTVTITTLGYGDFVPNKSGTMAQVLVVLELLTGLFFLTGVLARIITFKPDKSDETKATELNEKKG
jgi:hypothetical protein